MELIRTVTFLIPEDEEWKKSWMQTFKLFDNATVVEVNNDHNGCEQLEVPFDTQKQANSWFFKTVEQRIKQERQAVRSS